MPNAAVFKRAQGREVLIDPIFTSDLSDAATSYLFAPSEQFASFALRRLFGHSNIFEAELETLAPIITRLLASADVRQFIREIAKSESFRTRFFHPVNSLRFIEICFKNFLARAPYSQQELSDKVQLLNREGYNAVIDSIVDSAEYAHRFGTSILPNIALPGAYIEGMPSFNAQMRLQLPTRGATADSVCRKPMTTSVLAAGNAAAPVEIIASYQLSVPRYEPDMNWMDIPRSSLLKDWASASLILSQAVDNWSGLGTPRPTGQADTPWESGWQPASTGETWKPGWTSAKKKSYA